MCHLHLSTPGRTRRASLKLFVTPRAPLVLAPHASHPLALLRFQLRASPTRYLVTSWQVNLIGLKS